MSFSFNSQMRRDENNKREYAIQITTDNYKQFLFMQEKARECIDGKYREYKDALYAKFMYPDRGHNSDVEFAKKSGLKLGEKYEVDEVHMGQSSTQILLKGMAGCFNSVQFEFEEDDTLIDIIKSPKYNPYIRT